MYRHLALGPRLIRAAAVAITVLAGGALSASPTTAAPVPPDPYAEHVLHCQRLHGFDGTMNPGMHKGRSGWSPDHSCATHE